MHTMNSFLQGLTEYLFALPAIIGTAIVMGVFIMTLDWLLEKRRLRRYMQEPMPPGWEDTK